MSEALRSSITPHMPNVGRIMITNGGPHPAEFWAQVTAEQIAPISDTMTGSRRIAALQLQAKIQMALEPHHTKVQDSEHLSLTINPSYAVAPLTPETNADIAVRDVVAAARGTEWEKHFADDAVQAQIRSEIVRHFADVQSIARQWHKVVR